MLPIVGNIAIQSLRDSFSDAHAEKAKRAQQNDKSVRESNPAEDDANDVQKTESRERPKG